MTLQYHALAVPEPLYQVSLVAEDCRIPVLAPKSEKNKYSTVFGDQADLVERLWKRQSVVLEGQKSAFSPKQIKCFIFHRIILLPN